MRNKTVAMVALLVMAGLLSGCCFTTQTIQEKERVALLGAQKTWTGLVDSLATLREQGAFTREQANQVSTLLDMGNKHLEAWAERVKGGGTLPNALYIFQTIVTHVNAFKKMKG